jgi:hypothetical protein
MPDWTETAPPDAANYGYRLIRCPAARPLRAIVLSDRVIGTRTHYAKGRTLPCEGKDCEACNNALPWRWHAYLAILAGDNAEKCVLELTAAAAEQLAKPLKDYGTLRGLELLLERPARKPNGRIRILWKRNGTPTTTLPLPPSIEQIMLHIWGLDQDHLVPSDRKKPFDAKQLTAEIGRGKPISDSANP